MERITDKFIKEAIDTAVDNQGRLVVQQKLLFHYQEIAERSTGSMCLSGQELLGLAYAFEASVTPEQAKWLAQGPDLHAMLDADTFRVDIRTVEDMGRILPGYLSFADAARERRQEDLQRAPLPLIRRRRRLTH